MPTTKLAASLCTSSTHMAVPYDSIPDSVVRVDCIDEKLS